MLYEVDPGRQLQADFKEDLSIHLKNGDLIEFNVFSATLAIQDSIYLSIPQPRQPMTSSDALLKSSEELVA